MTHWIKTLLLAFALAFSALSAHAQDNRVYETITLEELGDIAKTQGYAVSTSPKGNWLLMIDGYKAILGVSDKGRSIYFTAGFQTKGDMDKVNAWNREKKYSQAYLDKDGEPNLDLHLDITGGVTRARIIDYLKTCRLSFNEWQKAVVD